MLEKCCCLGGAAGLVHGRLEEKATTRWEEIIDVWKGLGKGSTMDGGDGVMGRCGNKGFRAEKKEHRKKPSGPTFDFFGSQILGIIGDELFFPPKIFLGVGEYGLFRRNI